MVRHNERREDNCSTGQLIAIRLCPEAHKRIRRSRENAHRGMRTFEYSSVGDEEVGER